MTLSVTINSNAEQLAKKFDKDVERIKQFLEKAVHTASFVVFRTAKIRTPSDTGRLRNSMTNDIRGLTATIRPNTDYAVFVHEGTRYMRSRPYLKEGLSDAEKDVQQIFIKAVHDALQ